MRELFLRGMRSIYYWCSGLTLHLFSVELIEWGGGTSWEWLAVNLCAPFLSCLRSLQHNIVSLNALMQHRVFKRVCRIFVPPRTFTSSCDSMYVPYARVWCSHIGKALPLPVGTMQSDVTTGT